jgi:phage terminase large subunit-like protein
MARRIGRRRVRVRAQRAPKPRKQPSNNAIVTPPPPLIDPVTQYARDVVDGRIVAGRLVRLACARHLRDREASPANGLEWRPAEAIRVIEFFAEVLCLPEVTDANETLADDADPADGRPFVLEPWQAFIVGSLMGWYTAAGTRRFRDGYEEIGKGNGKTPTGAGLMLYLLVADGEPAAQVYFAAVSRDQARIAFADAEKMVKASPALRALVQQTANNLAVVETASFLRAISSEKRGLDGKRVHGALIDEEHEHSSNVVVSKMRRGTKGRRNALVLRTTNSGFDRTSICWHDHDYSRQVLEGVRDDPTWFAYVCGLDPCARCLAAGKEFPSDDCADCDDWRVEGPHWLKANPNLGVSLPWAYLRELVTQALGRVDAVADLLRFNFCVWTQAITRAISIAAWSACLAPPADAELVGVPCYGGLDLGQSDDFSAWLRGWMLDDGRLVVKCRFWIPESAITKYPTRPYGDWRRSGALVVTEGPTTDYGVIEAAVAADCQADGVREVAYDNRFAEQMAQNLAGQGITMVHTGQGFQLNEAIRRKLELVQLGTLCHGGDPILAWMASNYVVRHGTKGDMRPAKERASEKIDGQVALDMLIDRIVRRPKDPEYQVLIF